MVPLLVLLLRVLWRCGCCSLRWLVEVLGIMFCFDDSGGSLVFLDFFLVFFLFWSRFWYCWITVYYLGVHMHGVLGGKHLTVWGTCSARMTHA